MTVTHRGRLGAERRDRRAALDIAGRCRDTAHLRRPTRRSLLRDARVTIYLIRHAKAGDRDTWLDDDRLRPLSGRGHRQARLLIDVLEDATFDRVLSSPFVRCMETVVPIAGVHGRSGRTGRGARRRRPARRGARARAQARDVGCADVHARRRDADAARLLRVAGCRHSERPPVAEGLHVDARHRRAPAKSCARGTSPRPTPERRASLPRRRTDVRPRRLRPCVPASRGTALCLSRPAKKPPISR